MMSFSWLPSKNDIFLYLISSSMIVTLSVAAFIVWAKAKTIRLKKASSKMAL